jgi:uncharacterized protein
MNSNLRIKLVEIASKRISKNDPSHDFSHALRVLSTAEKIANKEGADLDVVVPAALFHDLVVYPKNHPDRMNSQYESAEATGKILSNIPDYPVKKIDRVKTCIIECSFTKDVVHEMLESQIVQDADGLEATGAISIMRTFATTGQMNRPFYNPVDPFCKTREPDAMKNALDLFYERLLRVTERIHTKTAKKISTRRTAFLRKFLKELDLELKGK